MLNKQKLFFLFIFDRHFVRYGICDRTIE